MEHSRPSPCSSSPITSRRTAAILSALLSSQVGSFSSGDGYHFDPLVASLIAHYAYDTLLPCFLLRYRHHPASRYVCDDEITATPDMHCMLEHLQQLQMQTKAMTQTHTQSPAPHTATADAEVAHRHFEGNGDDVVDSDELCRRSIRRELQVMRELSEERRWRCVACIAGERVTSGDPTLHSACLSPPYFVYEVVCDQHPLHELPTEAALRQWLLLTIQRCGGDTGGMDGLSIPTLLQRMWDETSRLSLFYDDLTMTLFHSASRLDSLSQQH